MGASETVLRCTPLAADPRTVWDRRQRRQVFSHFGFSRDEPVAYRKCIKGFMQCYNSSVANADYPMAVQAGHPASEDKHGEYQNWSQSIETSYRLALYDANASLNSLR